MRLSHWTSTHWYGLDGPLARMLEPVPFEPTPVLLRRQATPPEASVREDAARGDEVHHEEVRHGRRLPKPTLDDLLLLGAARRGVTVVSEVRWHRPQDVLVLLDRWGSTTKPPTLGSVPSTNDY